MHSGEKVSPTSGARKTGCQYVEEYIDLYVVGGHLFVPGSALK